jgi:hypothetical protein
MKKLRYMLFLLFSLFGKVFFCQAYLNEIIVKSGTSSTAGANQSLWFPSTSPFGSEGIEIYNPHCTTLDISNWILAVNGSTDETKGILRFPSGTSIPVGGRFLIGAPGTTANNVSPDAAIAVPASNTFATYRTNGYLATANTGRLFLDNPRGYVALYREDGTPVDCVFWIGSAGNEIAAEWGTAWGSYLPPTDAWDRAYGLGAGPASAITNIPQGDYGSLVAASTLATPGSAALNAVRRYAGDNIGNTGVASIQNVGDGQPTCQRVENITFGSANAGTAITCIILPIELISFDYKCNNDNIQLNWATQSELNNDYFTIMASSDGNEWIEISKIKGAGNSNELKEYSYSVPSSYSNYKYFKLKQTDFDGKYTYSKIVYANCDDANSIDYYPNPFDDVLTIQLKHRDEALFTIYDNLGQLVYSGKLTKDANQIDLNSLAAGIYYLQLDSQKTYKLIKK